MKTVRLINVSKHYRKRVVLNNINFSFDKGLYLVTGENGIGKSTLLKIIYGISKPTSGRVVNKGDTSYLPERLKIPNFVTVTEFLRIMLELKTNTNDYMYIEDSINKYLERFSIYKYKNYKMNTLSKGTVQKIMIIYTLINNGDLYLFDEPLNGLDYSSQMVFISILGELIDNNKVIIISTHYISAYDSLDRTILSIDNITKGIVVNYETV